MMGIFEHLLVGVTFLCLQLTAATPVTGFSEVVVHGPVQASAGGDVILPCDLDPPLSVTDLTVEWTKNGSIVHLYRHRKDDEDRQHEQFRGRTSLFHHKLIRGNISLKLTNVTEEDSGLYFCHVPKLPNSHEKRGNVNLTVWRNKTTEDDKKSTKEDQTGAIAGGVLGSLLFIFALSAVIYVFNIRPWRTEKKKQENDHHGDQPGTGEMIPLNDP